MIIFYSDGRFIEGFIQTDVISLIIQDSEKINLFEKRQNELNEFIKWFKKEYNKRNISNWYNEFHHAVEYDGTFDIERCINDFKKALE